MARRTYIPSLNQLTYELFRYLTRYRDKYYPVLSNDQQISVDLLIGACQSTLLLIPKPAIEPDA